VSLKAIENRTTDISTYDFLSLLIATDAAPICSRYSTLKGHLLEKQATRTSCGGSQPCRFLFYKLQWYLASVSICLFQLYSTNCRTHKSKQEQEVVVIRLNAHHSWDIRDATCYTRLVVYQQPIWYGAVLARSFYWHYAVRWNRPRSGLSAPVDAPSGEIFLRNPSPGPCQSACRISTS